MRERRERFLLVAPHPGPIRTGRRPTARTRSSAAPRCRGGFVLRGTGRSPVLEERAEMFLCMPCMRQLWTTLGPRAGLRAPACSGAVGSGHGARSAPVDAPRPLVRKSKGRIWVLLWSTARNPLARPFPVSDSASPARQDSSSRHVQSIKTHGELLCPVTAPVLFTGGIFGPREEEEEERVLGGNGGTGRMEKNT